MSAMDNNSNHHNNNNRSNNHNKGNNDNNNNNNSAVVPPPPPPAATGAAAATTNNNNNAHVATLSPNPAANNALHHIPSFEAGVKKGYQEGFEAGAKETKYESVNLRARVVHLEAQLQKHMATIKKLRAELNAIDGTNRLVEEHRKEQQQVALSSNNKQEGGGGEEGEICFTDFAQGDDGEGAEVTHNVNSNNDPSLKEVDDVTWDDSVSNRAHVSKDHSRVSSEHGGDDDDVNHHDMKKTTSTTRKLAPGSTRRAASLVESIESTSLVGGSSNVETTASGTVIPKQHVITAPPTSHVNYLYTSLNDVVYERFEAGKVFAVALPKSKNASHRIASECLLKTKALEAQRHVLTHCAHYYFNRICNRGDDCCFVHAISVPDIRVWGKTIDRQPIEFVGTSSSKSVPTTTVVIQQGSSSASRGHHHHSNSFDTSTSLSDVGSTCSTKKSDTNSQTHQHPLVMRIDGHTPNNNNNNNRTSANTSNHGGSFSTTPNQNNTAENSGALLVSAIAAKQDQHQHQQDDASSAPLLVN